MCDSGFMPSGPWGPLSDYSELLQESQQEEREIANAEERMSAQLRMSNINHLQLIEDKYRVRGKNTKSGQEDISGNKVNFSVILPGG